MSRAYVKASSEATERFVVGAESGTTETRKEDLSWAPWVLPVGANLEFGGGTVSDVVKVTVIYKIE